METLGSKPRTEPFERALRIEAGRVACPRRGSLDIERCWMCPQYRGMSEGRFESVICGLSEDSLASVLWAVERAQVATR